MASNAMDLDPTDLKGLLLEEIEANRSRANWGGQGVVIRFNQFSLTPKMKSETNEQGFIHGCHTCDSHLEIDSDQPWVGDHFPPSELRKHARGALDAVFGGSLCSSKTQVLRPQCNDCSNRQAALVRRLNTMTANAIVEWLTKDTGECFDVLCLIRGVDEPKIGKNCIQASGPTVTAEQGKWIQLLGIRDGCHSDPSHTVPATIYHADHTWPQEFCTNYMESILKAMGLLKYKPAQQELRPQCPRCSGGQGGKLSQISKVAKVYAKQNGIVSYK